MLRLMRPEILFPLFADVSTLKGVGPRSAPLVHKLAGPLVRDVLFLSPSGIIQRRRTTAAAAVEGEIGIFDVLIDRLMPPHKIGAPLKMRASDETGFVHLIWFAGSPRHIESLAPRGERRLVSGKVERCNNEVQSVHPDWIVPRDKAVDIPPVEPIYPATANLGSRVVRKLAQAALAQAKGALAQEQARYRQTDRDLKRIRELQKKGFASESELDRYISNFEQSKANLEAAQADHQIYLARYDKAVQTAFREVADALAQRSTLDDKLTAQRALQGGQA